MAPQLVYQEICDYISSINDDRKTVQRLLKKELENPHTMQKKCNALKEINAGRLIEVLGSEKDNMIVISDDEFGDSDGDTSSGLSMSEYQDDIMSFNSQSRVSAANKTRKSSAKRSAAGGKRDKVKINEPPGKSALD